jgi:rhodanese-related sulfurtransferase
LSVATAGGAQNGVARRQKEANRQFEIVIRLLFYNVGLDFNHIYHWNLVKFFIDNIWLIALALVSAGALLWPMLQRRGTKVSLLQATQLINQGKTIVLDVRSPADYATGHLPAAKNIPGKELATRIGELDKFKGKSVIVVCSSGVQSAKATGHLKKAGFDEVYSLEGGLDAWRAQGLPTAK